MNDQVTSNGSIRTHWRDLAAITDRLILFLAGLSIASVVAGVGLFLFLAGPSEFFSELTSKPGNTVSLILAYAKIIGVLTVLPAAMMTILDFRQPDGQASPYVIMGAIMGLIPSLLLFNVFINVVFGVGLAVIGGISGYVFFAISIQIPRRL